MIPLSDNMTQQINSFIQTGVLLDLLTLTNIDGSVVIRIVNNTEDVVFNGNTFYHTLPFKIDTITESNKGELPTINIILANVDRIIYNYIENDPDLGSGWSVHIDKIYDNDLASGVAEMQFDFVSMNATIEETQATFQCGLPNPLRQQFSRVRFMTNACQNTFKRGGCIYAGADTTCAKTLTACEDKFVGAVALPFFGFPGIPGQDIYL